MLTWGDAIGQKIRMGQLDENERRFVGWYLKPGMVVLDIGANIGFYTLLAANRVGTHGQVVAFEPSPREQCRLRWNLAINRCHNARVEPFALAANSGSGDLFLVLGRETGCNSMRPPAVPDPVERIQVSVTTLDGYLSSHGIRSVDFIKLDVEGAELEVLKGAKDLLATRPRPVMMCELTDLRTAAWNYRAGEVFDLLEQQGYAWFAATKHGYLRSTPRRGSFHGDLIAVPEERLPEVQARISIQPETS